MTVPTQGTRNWGTTLRNATWNAISAHNHTGSGNGAQLSSGALSAFSVTSAKLAKNIALYLNTSLLSPAGTTQTVSFDDGNAQKVSLASASGNVTLTLNNPQAGAHYKLFIIQGASPLSVVWPANMKWPQAQAPILSTSSGAVDIVDLFYDGTNFYGIWELDFS